jgi:outer membrane protein
MKKILFSLCLALSIVSSVSAQFFIGGSLGLTTQSGKTTRGSTSTDDDSYARFNFSPKAGFYLNDRFAIGLSLNYSTYSRTTPKEGTTPEEVYSESEIGFAPFVRYHFVEMGALSLFGEGSLALSFGSSSDKNGTVTTDGPKTTTFGINIGPGVSYKLSDHVAVEAMIGNISFINTSSKRDIPTGTGTTEEMKNSQNYFDFGISSGLSLGFIYKF